MSTAEPLLCLQTVSKAYQSASSPTVVLEDVGLTIRSMETVSLVGPSGSGKSTLLALIAGLTLPDSGSISVGGIPIASLDDTGRAALRASRIGIVLQSGNLIPFLTAVENVELAMLFTGGQDRRARALQLLHQLEVDHRHDHYPRQMSGGEAQRVAIAVALANGPDLLLADEVVGQLDSTTSRRVVDVIFGAGLAVLFVTHSLELASLAERQLRLEHRTVVEP